jgi:hypothetical protein
MMKQVVADLDAISRALVKSHSSMNARLIESTQLLITLFDQHADDLDRFADHCRGEERSNYRNKAKRSRSNAGNATKRLKVMKKTRNIKRLVA